MSEELDGLGTKFTVWYKIPEFTVEPELLVGPSCFAPECYQECCKGVRDQYRMESPLHVRDDYSEETHPASPPDSD